MTLNDMSKSDILNMVCVENTIDPSLFFEVLSESEPETMGEMKTTAGKQFAGLIQQFIDDNF